MATTGTAEGKDYRSWSVQGQLPAGYLRQRRRPRCMSSFIPNPPVDATLPGHRRGPGRSSSSIPRRQGTKE